MAEIAVKPTLNYIIDWVQARVNERTSWDGVTIIVISIMRLAVSKGKTDRIPLLFCGKTMIEDMKVLADLVDEGTVIAPRFLPPQFTDLMGLSA